MYTVEKAPTQNRATGVVCAAFMLQSAAIMYYVEKGSRTWITVGTRHTRLHSTRVCACVCGGGVSE